MFKEGESLMRTDALVMWSLDCPWKRAKSVHWRGGDCFNSGFLLVGWLNWGFSLGGWFDWKVLIGWVV